MPVNKPKQQTPATSKSRYQSERSRTKPVVVPMQAKQLTNEFLRGMAGSKSH